MIDPAACVPASAGPVPKDFCMTILDGVATPLGNALQKRGYTQLTPVQEAMLASDLQGRDALVSAKTGSGKTVAFGLAIAPISSAKTASSARRKRLLLWRLPRRASLPCRSPANWNGSMARRMR